MTAQRPSGAHLSARVVDITTLATDAIVNAANTSLAPGGGVCGAIHRAAGSELARACAALGGCPTGEARLTPGFRLAELLASAYRSGMRLAAAHHLGSIAFPAISTGIYGYPLAAATDVAVRSVRAALAEGTSVSEVVFACFSRDVERAYREAGVAG